MEWLTGGLAGGLAIGLLTGVLSGFGIGGGSLLLLWLTMAQGMEQLRAGGVNLLYFISCALPAIWGHIKNGLIEKKAVLWCVLAGIPASIAAAVLAAGMETGMLRRAFGGFLIAVGLRELFSRAK